MTLLKRFNHKCLKRLLTTCMVSNPIGIRLGSSKSDIFDEDSDSPKTSILAKFCSPVPCFFAVRKRGT